MRRCEKGLNTFFNTPMPQHLFLYLHLRKNGIVKNINEQSEKGII
jgi:hypothetical protein